MTNQLSLVASRRLVVALFAIVVVVAVIPVAIISLGPSDLTGGRGVRISSAHSIQTVPVAVVNHAEARILASEFKSDADALIVTLRQADTACSSSVTGFVAKAGLSTARATPILNQASAQLSAGLVSAVSRVQQEEIDVAHLRPLTTDTIDPRFADLNSIAAAGLTGACAAAMARVTYALRPQPQPQPQDDGRPGNGKHGHGGGGGD